MGREVMKDVIKSTCYPSGQVTAVRKISPDAQIHGGLIRRRPTQRRAHATEQAIVSAAEQVLVQVGYARASTNAIAKRAGVSVGSLYQYFSDKEAVFRALVRRHRDEVMPKIVLALGKMADPKQDFLAVVLELMRTMSRVNARNPRLMTAIDRELNWLEHETASELDVHFLVRQILTARYSLSSDDTAVIAELLVLTVSHLSRWLIHSKPEDLSPEAFIAAVGRMLEGLLPKAQSPSQCPDRSVVAHPGAE